MRLPLLPLLALSLAPLAGAKPLNVLFLLSDDLRPELACYGAPVPTPNIDRLAARGTRFTRAWVQTPLCNPSRTSLFTGRYPTTTRVLTNGEYFRDGDPNIVTLPQLFKNSGYHTLRAGKNFHGGIDDPVSWTLGAQRPLGSKPKDAPRKKTATPTPEIVVLEGNGDDQVDNQSAAQAVSWLEEYARSGKAFYLSCGFSRPHVPLASPRRFFEQLPRDSVTLPPDFAPRRTPPEGFPRLSLTENFDLFHKRDATPEAAREVIHAYRVAVTYMDWNVGRVLDALDRTGLSQSTFVVFWGDHGYHLGEKGKWSKHQSLFDLGLRVPLIVAGPNIPAGAVCERVVETIDLFPTLAELCALPPPKGLEGDSLVPLLKDPKAAWDKPAYAVGYHMNQLRRAVRDERWLYAEFPGDGGGEMLVDLREDPRETRNLAGRPEHAATRRRMQTLLSRLPREAKPLPPIESAKQK